MEYGMKTLRDWNSPKFSVSPFKRIIEQEGILLSAKIREIMWILYASMPNL